MVTMYPRGRSGFPLSFPEPTDKRPKMRAWTYRAIFCLLSLSLACCQPDLLTDPGYAQHSELYPLQTGNSWTYDVTDTEYFNLLDTTAQGNKKIYRWRLREEVGESLRDSQGYAAFRLLRYKRGFYPADTTWLLDSVWVVRAEPGRIVRVEQGIPYMALPIPARQGMGWDRNAGNLLGAFRMRVQEVFGGYEDRLWRFDQVVKARTADTTLVDAPQFATREDRYEELYAPGAGPLVRKQTAVFFKTQTAVQVHNFDERIFERLGSSFQQQRYALTLSHFRPQSLTNPFYNACGSNPLLGRTPEQAIRWAQQHYPLAYVTAYKAHATDRSGRSDTVQVAFRFSRADGSITAEQLLLDNRTPLPSSPLCQQYAQVASLPLPTRMEGVSNPLYGLVPPVQPDGSSISNPLYGRDTRQVLAFVAQHFPALQVVQVRPNRYTPGRDTVTVGILDPDYQPRTPDKGRQQYQVLIEARVGGNPLPYKAEKKGGD